MNYSEIVKKNEEQKNLDKKIDNIHTNNDYNKLLNRGFSIITKNNKTNKIEVINPPYAKYIKEKNKNIQNNLIFNKMIKNWNDFRDNENELRGDLSPYINYKNIIENMIKEDRKIENDLYERINNIDINDGDYSSDEENNKHLIY